jgi:tellurite resistance protein TerC
MIFAGIGTLPLWGGFLVFVLAMLALDLMVFHRRPHEVRVREAVGWSIFWITLACVFNGGLFYWFGAERGLEFLTGYTIEKTLSVDNLFVFLVILRYFSVPAANQHRVLFYGILGALVMRGIFIYIGITLLQFEWVIYVFGGFLIVTGVRLLRDSPEEVDPGQNFAVRVARRLLPMSQSYQGARFFTRENGRLLATPLLLVLVAIEATDLVFAVDSVPAVLAVTRDPFIVYTSNVFAILGLRSLYFVLSGSMGKFHYLNFGLALVLMFVGVKMLIAEIYKIPVGISLGTVGVLIAGSILASLLWPKLEPALSVPEAALEEGASRQPESFASVDASETDAGTRP